MRITLIWLVGAAAATACAPVAPQPEALAPNPAFSVECPAETIALTADEWRTAVAADRGNVLEFYERAAARAQAIVTENPGPDSNFYAVFYGAVAAEYQLYIYDKVCGPAAPEKE